jgi:hypothetical protein
MTSRLRRRCEGTVNETAWRAADVNPMWSGGQTRRALFSPWSGARQSTQYPGFIGRPVGQLDCMPNTPGPFPHPASSPGVGPIKLADGLGWASVALGVPMLTAPTRFPSWIGIESDGKAAAVTAFVGVRELSATFTINGMRHRRIGAWARVGGDTMDLVLLGRSFLTRRRSTPRLLGAIAFVAGIYVADIYTAIQLSRAEGVGMTDGSTSHGVGMTDETDTDVRTAITILKSEDEVRSAFADFGWTGFDPSKAETRGEVRITSAPGERGTELHVTVNGRASRVNDELRRFKALLETGVEPRSEKTPEGFSSFRQILQRPGQPVGGAV